MTTTSSDWLNQILLKLCERLRAQKIVAGGKMEMLSSVVIECYAMIGREE